MKVTICAPEKIEHPLAGDVSHGEVFSPIKEPSEHYLRIFGVETKDSIRTILISSKLKPSYVWDTFLVFKTEPVRIFDESEMLIK